MAHAGDRYRVELIFRSLDTAGSGALEKVSSLAFDESGEYLRSDDAELQISREMNMYSLAGGTPKAGSEIESAVELFVIPTCCHRR